MLGQCRNRPSNSPLNFHTPYNINFWTFDCGLYYLLSSLVRCEVRHTTLSSNASSSLQDSTLSLLSSGLVVMANSTASRLSLLRPCGGLPLSLPPSIALVENPHLSPPCLLKFHCSRQLSLAFECQPRFPNPRLVATPVLPSFDIPLTRTYQQNQEMAGWSPQHLALVEAAPFTASWRERLNPELRSSLATLLCPENL